MMVTEQLTWQEIREIIDDYYPIVRDKPLAASYLRWAKNRAAAMKALSQL